METESIAKLLSDLPHGVSVTLGDSTCEVSAQFFGLVSKEGEFRMDQWKIVGKMPLNSDNMKAAEIMTKAVQIASDAINTIRSRFQSEIV